MGKTRCLTRVERTLGHLGGQGKCEDSGGGRRQGELGGGREGGNIWLKGREGFLEDVMQELGWGADVVIRTQGMGPGQKQGRGPRSGAALPHRTFCDDESSTSAPSLTTASRRLWFLNT